MKLISVALPPPLLSPFATRPLATSRLITLEAIPCFNDRWPPGTCQALPLLVSAVHVSQVCLPRRQTDGIRPGQLGSTRGVRTAPAVLYLGCRTCGLRGYWLSRSSMPRPPVRDLLSEMGVHLAGRRRSPSSLGRGPESTRPHLASLNTIQHKTNPNNTKQNRPNKTQQNPTQQNNTN